jgi:hypothetical protein
VAGKPPEQVRVEKRISDDTFGDNMRGQEVLLEGDQRTWKYYKPVDQAVDLVAGLELEVWKNPETGKISVAGPRKSQAESQPQSQAGSQQQSLIQDDAVGRSIERQVAAKCAAELMVSAGYTRDTFAQDYRFYVDAIADAIKGEDESIPF